MRRPLLLAGLAVTLGLLPGYAAAQGNSGAPCAPPTITAVEIHRDELFPKREGKLGWVYRIGNKLHIDTRESVVGRELLFAVGEQLDPEDLAQSERNLRAQRFLSEARVEVVTPDGRVLLADDIVRQPLCRAPGLQEVTVRVTTRDSWSLSLEAGANKTGNRLLWNVGIDESNLLGLGKSAGFGYRTGIDRNTFQIGMRDPQVLGTLHELTMRFSDQSDGSSFRVFFARPVKSLDDTWTYDGTLETFEQTQPLYEAGDQIGGLRHVRRHQAVQVGKRIHRSPASTMRLHLGVRNEFDDIQVERRDFTIIQVGATFSQHRYQQLRWIDHERPVDVNLGAESGVFVGYAARVDGTRKGTTLFIAGNHAQGVSLGRARLFRGSASWASRVRDGVVENGTLRSRLLFLDHSINRQAFLLSGELTWGVNLDPEVQITAGGNTGLRGYAVNQFVGNRSLVLSAEHRWFFDDDMLGIASLGLAGFVDSGFAWPKGQPVAIEDLHTNVGLGLLIGRKQLSTANAGMRIDMAYALNPVVGRNRWLLTFGTTHGF